MVQVGVIAVAMIAAVIAIVSGGGITEINAAITAGTVPSGFWRLDAIGLKAILFMVLPVALAALCDQQTVQRINAAKSEKVSMTAHIISTLMCIGLALLPAIIGMYGAAVYGVTDNTAFFQVVMHKLPPLVSAITIAAVIAAIMSTIDGTVIAFSTVMLKNVYQGMINPKVDEKTLKKGDTILSIVVLVFALVLSLQFDNIINLLSSTYIFLTACCLVPFVGGMYWKRGTAKGATVSSIVGLIISVLNMTKIYVLPMSDFSPIIIALGVYVIVSLCDKEGQKRNLECNVR